MGGICVIIASFISGGYFQSLFFNKNTTISSAEKKINDLKQENSELQEKLDILKNTANASEKKKVKLTQLEKLSKSRYASVYLWEHPKDNLGNVYEGYGISFQMPGEPYIICGLDRKYSKLTGTCILAYGDRTTHCDYFFDIYGDDEIICVTDYITGGEFPVEFEVDVRNVNILKIVLRYGQMWDDDKIGLVNLYLEE